MQKDDKVFLSHMLDMARSAIQKVRGKSREDFDQETTSGSPLST